MENRQGKRRISHLRNTDIPSSSSSFLDSLLKEPIGRDALSDLLAKDKPDIPQMQLTPADQAPKKRVKMTPNKTLMKKARQTCFAVQSRFKGKKAYSHKKELLHLSASAKRKFGSLSGSNNFNTKFKRISTVEERVPGLKNIAVNNGKQSVETRTKIDTQIEMESERKAITNNRASSLTE